MKKKLGDGVLTTDEKNNEVSSQEYRVKYIFSKDSKVNVAEIFKKAFLAILERK